MKPLKGKITKGSDTKTKSPKPDTVDGETFLREMIDAISGGDDEERAQAQTMLDAEEFVETFVESVRAELRTLREAQGLNLDQAADKLGVSPATLSRLESGASRKLDLKMVARVALMLEATPQLVFIPSGATVGIAGIAFGLNNRYLAEPRGSVRAVPKIWNVPAGPVASNPFNYPLATIMGHSQTEREDMRIKQLEERVAVLEDELKESGA